MPWPAPELTRSNIGLAEDVASCRAAVIFKECQAATRPSFSPVVSRMLGQSQKRFPIYQMVGALVDRLLSDPGLIIVLRGGNACGRGGA